MYGPAGRAAAGDWGPGMVGLTFMGYEGDTDKMCSSGTDMGITGVEGRKGPSEPSVSVVTVRSRGGALLRPLRFLFCLVAMCGSTKYLVRASKRVIRCQIWQCTRSRAQLASAATSAPGPTRGRDIGSGRSRTKLLDDDALLLTSESLLPNPSIPRRTLLIRNQSSSSVTYPRLTRSIRGRA